MTLSRTAPQRVELFLVVVMTLVAFALRLVFLAEAPPGWRDDELINIHALAGELSEGRFPVYFSGASGHEPLYHYLQAGSRAVFGQNVLSAHVLSTFFGVLTIPLTYVLVRRLFGVLTGILTALALTTSFWSLMYSRIALRHINLPPVLLAAFFLLWLPLTTRPRSTLRWAIPLGIVLGLSLYIYPAARLLPVLLLVFGLYLALIHRNLFHRVLLGYGVALVITVLLALPLVAALAQGSSDAAAQGIGADARLVELARPVRALQEGDPRPLLESIWTTLGMFHATGDPEWLYNIPNRPLFNALGGVLFWAGVLVSLFRWHRPRYFFLLLWFGFGLLPTVLSVPPASLSHSIMIQSLIYLFPALTLEELFHWFVQRRPKPGYMEKGLKVARYAFPGLMVLFLFSTAVRDLRDYFTDWPREDMVRFLYRADYRKAAEHLDEHPEIKDVAIGSTLFGPWDRLALEDDLRRKDVRVRLFNPERSLILSVDAAATGQGSRAAAVFVTLFPHLNPSLAALLGGTPIWQDGSLELYQLPDALPPPSEMLPSPAMFSNGLELISASWPGGEPRPGQEATLWLIWRVARPLDLPPIPIVANPPPPGVYNGPRLAVFTHLLGPEDTFLVGHDGLWVDPVNLWPGDRFVQIHLLTLQSDAPPGPYVLEVGLYDPMTDERRLLLDVQGQAVADRLLLRLGTSER